MDENILNSALKEDLSDQGDITGEAIFTDEEDKFVLVSKEAGILCGIDEFCSVFKKIDPGIGLKVNFRDGQQIKCGDEIVIICGRVSSILKAERSALNILSHLSGIATRTAKFVQAAEGKAIILDTRKTLPGLRDLQKYAVRCGGGQNHRMGLYDMVMIKDNHIDAAGGIALAVQKIRKKWNNKYKIEVEARNLSEVLEALSSGVDRIMLDNMSLAAMQKAVATIAGRCETEASGNMTLQRIPKVAATGVDFISVGELTHSVKALDFSLKKIKLS